MSQLFLPSRLPLCARNAGWRFDVVSKSGPSRSNSGGRYVGIQTIAE